MADDILAAQERKEFGLRENLNRLSHMICGSMLNFSKGSQLLSHTLGGSYQCHFAPFVMDLEIYQQVDGLTRRLATRWKKYF